MQQRPASDGCGRVTDPPRDVQVTIVRAPRPGAARARVVGVAIPPRAAFTVVLLLAAVAAVISTTRGMHPSPTRAAAAAPLRASADNARTPAVAAVYRYPLGCLGASLSSGPAASGVADRAGPCWRYGVFLTAVLRESRGVWRLGLEAVSRTCPRVSLPRFVRVQLLACRR